MNFKGKNLEKLVIHIIKDEVENLGLEIVEGNKLERTSNLPEGLGRVKRNLLIDYGKFGSHLPDEDKTLSIKTPAKKGRAIVEIDTDGSYIMSEEKIDESNKVKKFDKFISDLEALVYAKRNKK